MTAVSRFARCQHGFLLEMASEICPECGAKEVTRKDRSLNPVKRHYGGAMVRCRRCKLTVQKSEAESRGRQFVHRYDCIAETRR